MLSLITAARKLGGCLMILTQLYISIEAHMMNIGIHPIPESIWDFWLCMCYILPEIKPQHHYYLSKLCHLSYLHAIKSQQSFSALCSCAGDLTLPITSSLYSSSDSEVYVNIGIIIDRIGNSKWCIHDICMNDVTLSRNLIGCSTLSQE